MPVASSDSNQQYIVMIKEGNFWADAIWYVQFDGKKIVSKKEIQDVSGNILSCQTVELSQGTFIEFFEASDMGNGDTVLWNPVSEKIEYEFDKLTIDSHKEESISTSLAKKYNLPKILEDEGQGYSFVYQGDRLTSYYKDINNDGYKDAIFYGINNLISCENEIPIKMFSVKQVYLYDKNQNTFVYNEKLSENREVK